jgi:hypothetical protein
VNATAGNGVPLTKAARARRREAVAAERQVEAFRWRADEGLSFEEIAVRLGVSRATAWKCYQRELATVRELVDPYEVREHVAVQLHRLDRALGTAVVIMDDPDQAADVRLRAIDRVLRVEERRARLLGLDRPARAELGIRPLSPREELSSEQVEEELASWALMAQSAVQIAQGPESVPAPADA